MAKPFKTLEEQVELMKNRGLYFDDEEKAKSYLLLNNYYNVINYYSKFFMNGNDYYINEATFDEVSHVYYFDKEIKGIFFKTIMEIEKHIKSIIAYVFSEEHQEDFSYLNAKSFKNNDIIDVTQTIAYLSKIITRKQREKDDNSVKHYMKKHHNVPLWVLCNYMTFGQTIMFYKHMKDAEQNKIAKIFSQYLRGNLNIENTIVTPTHILSYLNNICEVRNIVAHGNKFLGFKCKNNTLYLPELHSFYEIHPDSPRQDVYNVFITMNMFLEKHQFAIMNNSLRKRAQQLSKHVKSINHNYILSSLGFPQDWQNRKCLQQD